MWKFIYFFIVLFILSCTQYKGTIIVDKGKFEGIDTISPPFRDYYVIHKDTTYAFLLKNKNNKYKWKRVWKRKYYRKNINDYYID